MKRKTRYYVVNIILPTAFVSFVGMLTFILPPGSGEKVRGSCASSFVFDGVRYCSSAKQSWTLLIVLWFCEGFFLGEPGGDCSVGKYCYFTAGVRQFTTAVRTRANIVLAAFFYA